MKNLRKDAALNALIGAVCGIFINVIISFFCAEEGETIRGNLGLIIQTIGAALYGAVCMGGAIVYKMEEWGVVRCTIIHYLLVMVALLIANVCLHWFPWGIFGFVVLGFTVGYFIIWLIQYLGWKREIRQMNEELKERGERD